MKEQKRIVVVEDESNWRDTLQDILKEEGYSVEATASYDEARRKLEEPFDLAVIDLKLGEKDEGAGITLLDDAHYFGIPVVVITGFATELLRMALGEYGVYDFVDKAQFDPQEFKEIIREALDADRQPPRALTLGEQAKLRRLMNDFYRGKVVIFEK